MEYHLRHLRIAQELFDKVRLLNSQSDALRPLRSDVTQLTILSSCYFEYHALLSDGIITPISFFWQGGLVKYNPDSKVNKVRERVF